MEGVQRKASNFAVKGDPWKPLTGIRLRLAQLGALTKKNVLIR